MYFKTLAKSECCACTACEQACPVHAISFEKDEEGFLYPVINKEMCIECGLCERICPVENPNFNNTESPEVYAAMVKDVEQRKKSSSGGMFYVIASWIIHKGGKVYGATMDENHQVKHIGVDNFKDLNLLRGSKYVQSDLQQVFSDIKKELKAGRWCYFVGTGCQVAGLKSFLRKDYDTLLTSDLVCHGVPSQWLFDQHIQYLEEKYKGKVSNYQFRNNELWGGCEIFKLQKYDGKIKQIKNSTYYLSPYLYSFMYGKTSRFSCYGCKFACIPRQGDVTLADFWGVSSFIPKINSANGVSLFLVNNKKGMSLKQEIKHLCDLYPSRLEDGARYNENLIVSSSIDSHRKDIYKKIKVKGYSFIANEEFRAPNLLTIKFLVFLQNTPILKQLWKFVAMVVHKIHRIW